MKYKVIWLPFAEAEFEKIWKNSENPAAITEAALKLEFRLKEDGPDVGESRANHMRITFEDHLGILFLVTEIDRTVLIGRVWEFE